MLVGTIGTAVAVGGIGVDVDGSVVAVAVGGIERAVVKKST